MKKSFRIILIIGVLALTCLNFFVPEKKEITVSANESSFADFNAQFQLLTQDDDFSTTIIDKNISREELVQSLSGEEENNVNTFSRRKISSTSLENEEVFEICDELDYSYSENENGYEVYNKYQLKRIIVTGKVKNDFGANKKLTYKDYNILSYETEEQTKYAYEQLLKDDSLIVVLDDLMKVNDVDTYSVDYDYSTHVNEWGARSIDLGYYNNFLASTNSNEEVVVAVIDTGVYTSHTLFTNRILKDGDKEVGYAYSGTGYFYNDGAGHGTHVAGTIADLTPQNVKILPMKVFDDNGEGSLSYVTTALTALTSDMFSDYNIVAANMSLGNKNVLSSTSLTYWDNEFSSCFKNLRDNGILPIVAAGNEKQDTTNVVPARCDNAITVSSVYGFCGYTEKPYYRSQNYTGNYYFDSNYSNFGEDIDIAATGTWILSASNESMYEYTWMAGTSMAAPHVAAAVALLNLDKTAEYTSVDDIENRLYGCAVDLGDAGTDIYYGNGLLNLKKTSGYIGYKVNDVTAIYDGKYHNINVYDVDVQNYTISYMFETETTYSADVSNNDNFKNYTYGSRAVYFKISSEFHMDTIGVAYLTINKANVEIAIDNQTAVYGDEFVLQNNKFSVVSGTFYDSDIEDVNLVTKANKTSPVGSYNITATAGDNYNLTYQKGSFIITQRPLTIISQNQTSIYGENVSLNLQKYTFSGGIVNNDDIGITLSTEANNLSACGKYDINIDCLGDDVGNYAITKKCGKLTIEKRSIIIRLQNQQAAYGKEIKLKLLYDVLSDYKIVNDDDLNMVLSTDATSTSPVGNYSITLTYNNDNYDVTVIDGVLEMKEKGIEIIILDQMSVYGDVVQLDQTKFVYVDEADKDKVEVVLSTLATNESAAGSYDIVATTNDPNVLIMYDNPGKLNIAKRKITIELKDQKFAHGFDLDIDQSEYEIVEGCLINDDDLELTIYSDAEKFSMLGSYELKAKSNNSNYEVEVINAKLTLKVSMIDILAGVVAVIGICAIIGAIVKFKKARENNLNFTKKIKW